MVAGGAAVGVAREVDGRSQPPGRALHSRAPRSVTDDGQVSVRMALEYARHGGEHRREVIARLDSPEPQEPRRVWLKLPGAPPAPPPPPPGPGRTEGGPAHTPGDEPPRRRPRARHRA